MSMNSYSSFLKDHLTAFLEFKARLGCTSYAGSSKRSLAQDLDSYLVFFGIWSLPQLTPGSIESWIHINDRLANVSKNKRLSFIRGLFDYLIRIGVTDHNPAERIPWLRKKPFKPHVYTLIEIDHFLREAAKPSAHDPNGSWACTFETMLFLIYACGLRLGEALSLNIEDVDFDENILALWKTKFHKERLVPFSTAVAERLKSYLLRRQQLHPLSSPKLPFFCCGKSRLRPAFVEKNFRHLLVRCGLAKPKGHGPRLHDLRHSFAVHRLYKWYQDGKDPQNKLPLLSTYMGHISIEGTQVYLAVTQEILREADRRFQNAFEDVVRKSAKRAGGS